jgi:hypothetical protein
MVFNVLKLLLDDEGIYGKKNKDRFD